MITIMILTITIIGVIMTISNININSSNNDVKTMILPISERGEHNPFLKWRQEGVDKMP